MKVGYVAIKWESRHQQGLWVAPLSALKLAHIYVVFIALIGFLAVIFLAIAIMNATPSKGIGTQGMLVALPAIVVAVGWMVYWINHGSSWAMRRLQLATLGSGEVFVGLNSGSDSLLIHAPVTEYQDCGWLSFRDGRIVFRGELYELDVDLESDHALSVLNQVFGNQKLHILKLDLVDQSYYFSTPDRGAELLLKHIVNPYLGTTRNVQQVLRLELASLPAVRPLVLGGANLAKIGIVALGVNLLLGLFTILILREQAGVLIGAWTVPSMVLASVLVLRKQIQYTTFGEASASSKGEN